MAEEAADAPLGEQVNTEPSMKPPDLEELWEKHKTDHNFFKEIELAKDGGMSEASELISTMRYITGALPILFVLLNAYSILTTNFNYIINLLVDAPAVGTQNDEGAHYFLVIRYIAESFEGVSIPEDTLALVGLLEVALMMMYLLRLFYWLYYIWCPGSGEYAELNRWQAVQEFFWNALPEASTISTVKLLNFVTPAVLLPALMSKFNTNCIRIIPGLLFFLVTRIIAGLIGFDALLFKLQVNQADISSYLCHQRGDTECARNPSSTFDVFVNSAVFLNQILGIVQIGWFVKRRIFAFIFAGEDGRMSEEEEAIKETWESMLAQQIWKRNDHWYQCMAVYLSYSDYDFQKLALETRDPDKTSKRNLASKRNIEMAAQASGS